MDLGLKDKRVFITASSAGIGRATAELFLQESAVVIMNGRNADRLQEVVSALQKHYGEKRVYGVLGDMSREMDIENSKQQIENSVGGLDLLIGNLGTGKAISTDKLDIAEWKYMLDMNLLSTVSLIRCFEDLLVESSNAGIVLLTSLAAFDKIGAPPAYAAAKSAVKALVKYLADDYAKYGIRVNGVSPGNVYYKGGRWEEIEKENPDGTLEYIESSVPMKRFGTPEEIANAIVFLSSEKASFITGTVLKVDGGQSRGF